MISMRTKEPLQYKRLFIMFLLLPFLEPSGIAEMSNYIGGAYKYIDQVYTGLTLISYSLILVLFFGRRNIKPSKILVIILAYLGWLLLSAALNDNFTSGYLIMAMKAIGLCIMTDYYMQTGGEKKFLSAVCTLLEVIIMSFVCIIVYPNGMYTNDRNWTLNWLLGYKNLHIYYFVPYLEVKTILLYMKKERLTASFYAMCALIAASVILVDSTTSQIVMLVFIVCIVLFKNLNLPKFVNPFNIMLASAIISFVFIVLGYISDLLPIVEALFGKDTLYRRNLIWTQSLLYIAENPIIGKGNFSFDLNSFTWTITQVHNKFMDLLITGGIVLVALFFLIFISLTKEAREIKQFQYRNVVNFSFALYAVLFLMESRRQDYLFFMVIMLASYIPKIAAKYGEDTDAVRKNGFRIGKVRIHL